MIRLGRISNIRFGFARRASVSTGGLLLGSTRKASTSSSSERGLSIHDSSVTTLLDSSHPQNTKFFLQTLSNTHLRKQAIVMQGGHLLSGLLEDPPRFAHTWPQDLWAVSSIFLRLRLLLSRIWEHSIGSKPSGTYTIISFIRYMLSPHHWNITWSIVRRA